MTVLCPHAERCPGCPLIGEPAAAQLAAKAHRLAASLAYFPELGGIPLEPVRPAATSTGYRVRAKLVVAQPPPGACAPRVGLFARGGEHEVLDLPECRVLTPALADAAAGLRRLLAAPGLLLDGATLRGVDLREVRDVDGSGVLVTLVLAAARPPDAPALEAACDALAREIPALRGVAVSLHDGRSPQLLGRSPRVARGPALHRDSIRPGAPWTLVSHGSFAQAHRGQAGALQQEVERALGALRGRRVLELFAGSGSLSLALAAAGAQVTSVEAFAPAAEAAARAAGEQGLTGLDARAGSAESWLPQCIAAGERFDAIVVNPPRRGLAPRVREAIAELAAPCVVYVSCEPATLARDLAHLARLGLRSERLVPFDMMPLTAEVECLARLRRAAPTPPALLFEDESLVAVDQPPFSAPLEGWVPLSALEPGASGIRLFARSPEAAPGLRAALADATLRHVALVRGVARARGRLGRRSGTGSRYRRLAVVAGHALLEVQTERGPARGVRTQLASVGEPVLGDARRGHAASNRHLFERFGLDRPFLHCASLALEHRGRALRLESPLAPDLALVLARLGAIGDSGREPM